MHFGEILSHLPQCCLTKIVTLLVLDGGFIFSLFSSRFVGRWAHFDLIFQALHHSFDTDAFCELVANPKRIKELVVSTCRDCIEGGLGGKFHLAERADHSEWGPGKHPFSFIVMANVMRSGIGNSLANVMNAGSTKVAGKSLGIPEIVAVQSMADGLGISQSGAERKSKYKPWNS